jgi:hypothetical protein
VINLILSVFVLYKKYKKWSKDKSPSPSRSPSPSPSGSPSPSPSRSPSPSESPFPTPSSVLLSPKQLNNLPNDILEDYNDTGNKIIKSEQLLISMGKEDEYQKLVDSWTRINDLILIVASNPDKISTVHDIVIKTLEKISYTLDLLLLSIPPSTSRCLPGDC